MDLFPTLFHLKQQVLCLQLEPKVGIEDVDKVVDDVSEAAGDNERLPAEDVWPGTGKQRDHYAGHGLQEAVDPLQNGHMLLHLSLDFAVVALDEVATDIHAVVEVYRASLLYVHFLHDQHRYALHGEVLLDRLQKYKI